jgi:hypothetical protein
MAQTTSVKLQGPTQIVSGKITEADTNTTRAAVELPAKSWVPPYGVSIYIAEAFAGGTPSFTIGDGDDTDGWAVSTDITETTVGTYTSAGAAYAVTGRYYSAADTIDVVVSASLTDGTAYLVVHYYDWSDLDVAAS